MKEVEGLEGPLIDSTTARASWYSTHELGLHLREARRHWVTDRVKMIVSSG
jgi:hypothetical protein